MAINSMAHTLLTSGNFPALQSFYNQRLQRLGLQAVIDDQGLYY
jgi:hypothetical protein